ncbi:MAG: hypothetical protein HOV96_06075 [Nonomuraea sp.]|nr:hypothetical protein [Nonomuraea sp.]NUP64732.1 hypothetical protein [Nonomuraea sp.]NUP77101.1 hypothetical protein [Nonomuraea sp.]NUS03088.1 hypothetical protein [Nonomuraea sp.]NUT43648.1 hypothetical protein [Thermoactinospora sp.]
MTTPADLLDAQRRVQALSDQHWHSLDEAVRQMAAGRTWTGTAADAFAQDLMRHRTEMWRALRDIIEELRKEAAQYSLDERRNL